MMGEACTLVLFIMQAKYMECKVLMVMYIALRDKLKVYASEVTSDLLWKSQVSSHHVFTPY